MGRRGQLHRRRRPAAWPQIDLAPGGLAPVRASAMPRVRAVHPLTAVPR